MCYVSMAYYIKEKNNITTTNLTFFTSTFNLKDFTAKILVFVLFHSGIQKTNNTLFNYALKVNSNIIYLTSYY